MRGPRAYSLIELALSMAIASIVATAAIGTFAIVNRQVVQLRTESAVETKLQRMLGGLVGDLQEVGGGAIRPWQALFVRPGDAASNGADGILALTADLEHFGVACPVVSYDGTVLTAGTVPSFPPDPPHCCLNDGFVQGRFAVVTLGADSVVVGIGSAALPGCTVNALPLLAPQRSDTSHEFELGTMTIVDAKWIALDTAKHELNAHMLRCDSIVADPAGSLPPSVPLATIDGTKRTLAHDVYDFQVANGYDMDLDGSVTENVGGASDEWLGNAGSEIGMEDWLGDELSETAGGFLASRYRMVEIGLVVGLKSKITKVRDATSILDGPAFTDASATHSSKGLYLRAGKARVLLRNTGLYE